MCVHVSYFCFVSSGWWFLCCVCVRAQDHTKEELDAWKIVRVSEDFRVIALGLPVPRYTGNPLDPPLRSRFQARDVHYLPFKVKRPPPPQVRRAPPAL